MSSTIRLRKEYENLKTNPPANCSAAPKNESNLYEWDAQLYGPCGTPYENGIFKLNINYPITYPFKPPKIHFITKIYHPNIDSAGNICLDILKDKWSPALTIGKVLLSICSLLDEPNPDDPLVSDIANEYKNNLTLYESNAKYWTQLYASC